MIEQGPPIPFREWKGMMRFVSENLQLMLAAERSADPMIRFSDLDRGWFATYFTRLMTMEAWNHQKGVGGTGPMTTDVIRSSERELVKLLNIERALGTKPKATKKKELLKLREDASRKVLLAAFTGASDAKSLANAADKTLPVLRQIYDWVAEHMPADPLGAPPEVSAAILKRLGLEGVYSLRVAAAKDQAEDLGTLPALAETAKYLEGIGLLDHATFADVVVRLRSHTLPSFEQLVRTMERH